MFALPTRKPATARLQPLPLSRCAAPLVQPKLRIGAVDGPLEREADRVADQVASGAAITVAASQISRKCAACEAEDEIRREAAGSRESASGLTLTSRSKSEGSSRQKLTALLEFSFSDSWRRDSLH
jgi:hypothetical protein